jgi:3'-phosphoadenosine 5'-phosphosulfate sulfotransferase (PAPS reductase)/FAD synthetase
MSKIDLNIFRQRYSLPMEAKLVLTQQRIKDFYNHFDGKVFLSFSGGKDSQVLAEIIRNMPSPYNSIELVFFDTHNENPSVFAIVERYGAKRLESPLTPKQVIEKVGYPLFNKEVANVIDDIQRGVKYTNNPNAKRRAQIDEIKNKYADFINSPLRISDKCCDELKKKLSHGYARNSGKKPIIATLAIESRNRMISYLNHGCNTFEGAYIKSTPMGMWSRKDVLEYIAKNNIQIAQCYGAEIKDGECILHGCKQTGCMFCGFGKGVNFAYKILKSKYPEYYNSLNRED